MASSIYNKVSNITFKVKGFNEITQYQKFLLDGKKKELDAQRAIVAAMNGTESTYAKQVKQMNKLEKEFDALEKEALRFNNDINAVRSTIEDLGNASPKAINKLNSVFARMSKQTSAWSTEAKQKFEALIGAVYPVTQAMSDAFKKGFTDMMKFKPNTASWQQLNNYVKQFNQNGRELAQVADNEASAFAKMGKIATEAKIKMGELDGTLAPLKRNASPDTIQGFINGWQKIAEFSGATATQIKDANNKIAAAKAQVAKYDMRVVANPNNFAPKEVQESTERLKNYLNTTRLTAAEQAKLNAAIKQGTEASKQMSRNINLDYMVKQFRNIKNVSNDALNAQKTYWTEMMNSVSVGSAKYNDYARKLEAVVAIEQKRANAKVSAQGNAALNRYQNGAIEGSTAALQQNIDYLTKWQSLINQDKSPQKFMLITNAINDLKVRLTQASEGVKMAQQYMNGGFGQASINDLERIKQGLMDMRKNVKGLDAKQIQNIDNALLKVDADLRTAGISAQRLDEIIKNPKGVYSIKELQVAYDKLKLEINQAGISQEDFNKRAVQMKAISTQVNTLKNQFRDVTESSGGLMKSFATNIKNFVMHYVGLQMIVMRIINVCKNNVKLSDQMTNVQKVTGMANEEIINMTRSIYAIDTRESNENLMAMAEQAGKLGIATREGAAGIRTFVEAGTKITNVLGDIGGAETINELLKVNDVINANNGQSKGMLQDLNNIGSAVLNIGNNSKATYKAVVEYTKKLGPAAASTHLRMTDVMGLGGAFSALGTDTAVAATATQRVLMGIVNNVEGIAKVLNLSTQELKSLVSDENGGIMDALYMVLDRLGEQGAEGVDKFLKVLGGRYNQQARSALMLLTNNVNTLRYEVALANEGFRDGTLIDQEYERANNNLAGVLSRIGNEFQEIFTTISGSNGFLRDTANSFLNLVQWMRETGAGAVLLTTGIAKLVLALGAYVVEQYKATVATSVAQGTFKGFAGTLTMFVSVPLNLLQLGYAKLTSNTILATKAQQGLNLAFKSNPLGIIVTVLATLISIYSVLKNKAKEAADATKELVDRADEEADSIRRLKEKINDTNTSQQRRIDLINEFNRKAGTYISNMLKEASTAKQVAAAYSEAAAAIHKKNKESALSEGEQKFNDASKDGRFTADGALRYAINKYVGNRFTKGEKADLAVDIESELLNYFKDESIAASEKTVDKAMAYLRSMVGSKYNYTAYGTGGDNNTKYSYNYLAPTQIDRGNKNDIFAAAKNYAKALVKGLEAQMPYVRASEVSAKSEQKANEETLKQLLGVLKENALTDNNRLKTINKYIKKSYELYGYTTSEAFNLRRELPALIAKVKPWGVTDNKVLEEMDGDELAKVADYFKNISKFLKPGQKLTGNSTWIKPIGVNLPDDIDSWGQQNIKDWAYAQWKYVLKLQDENNHANAKGNFVKGRTSSESSKWKKEMDLALKRLEEYYNKRKMLIEQQLAQEEITKQEYDRRMAEEEKGHLTERRNLNTKFINAAWQFTNDDITELMKDVKFKDIQKWLETEGKDGGKSYVDGIRNEVAKDGVELYKTISKMVLNINKVALDDMATTKIVDQLKNTLDTLDLLFIRSNDKSEAEGRRRALIYAKLAEDIAKLSSKQPSKLVSMLKEYGIDFSYESDPNKQVEVDHNTLREIIKKVREAYWDLDDAIRKEASKDKKTLEFQYKATGAPEKNSNELNKRELRKDLEQTALSLGGTTQYGVDMADLDIANQKVAAEKEYLDFLEQEYKTKLDILQADIEKAKMTVYMQEQAAKDAKTDTLRREHEAKAKEADLRLRELELQYQTAKGAYDANISEQRQKLEEARLSKDKAEMDIVQNKLAYVKEYMSSIEEFGKSMSEAAFGTKEDREKAAKDMLTSFINTTSKIITQGLVYLATRSTMNEMEVLMNKKKNMQILADDLQRTGKTITLNGIEMNASMAASTAQGIGKEVAQAGIKGLIIGAAITAAMAAITAAATAALNKGKNAVNSVSAGKMSTGMLTYAKGYYPTYGEGTMQVQGNDGHQYNAVVKPNLTTGEYTRPHLGIVGEKGAELIVDHPTFSRLKSDAPWVLSAVYNMKRFGRVGLNYGAVNAAAMNLGLTNTRGRSKLAAIPTHADGNIEDVLGSSTTVTDASTSGSNAQLEATLGALTQAIVDLQQKGVKGHFSTFGDDGLVATYDKGKSFLNSVGK